MSLTYRETQIVKGMLERGDKQHDIAAYFGVNGGRIAEVATGKCDYPGAPPASAENLPPPGPYVGAKSVQEIREILSDASELIAAVGDSSEEAKVALEALALAIKRLD
ncbi:hypothetical protein [Pararhodobacter sp.]|uniref:hypothetical protein n=1 Tax=Pararhodobacter sp. TaxID=2127056 RepID=UPI002FE28055|nr:hypothetical protein [Pseudomonadota bacterium]